MRTNTIRTRWTAGEAVLTAWLTIDVHTGSPAYARQMIDKGFQLVTVQTDAAFLEAEARRVVAGVKQTAEQSKDAGPY